MVLGECIPRTQVSSVLVLTLETGITHTFLIPYRVPSKQDVAFGSIQQGSMCIDTLGHFADGTVGLFVCHNTGGNQEWAWTKDHNIKHVDLCITLTDTHAGSPVKLYSCSASSSKQVRRQSPIG